MLGERPIAIDLYAAPEVSRGDLSRLVSISLLQSSSIRYMRRRTNSTFPMAPRCVKTCDESPERKFVVARVSATGRWQS